MSTQPTKAAIIFSGEELIAKFVDGTSSQVRVRAFKARHFPKLLALCDEEAECIEFCTRVPNVEGDPQQDWEPAGWHTPPEHWADNLTPESHLELYEAAKRLNFSNLKSWAQRQIKARQFSTAIAMKAEEALRPMVREIAGLVASFSPPSASPAKPATKS